MSLELKRALIDAAKELKQLSNRLNKVPPTDFSGAGEFRIKMRQIEMSLLPFQKRHPEIATILAPISFDLLRSNSKDKWLAELSELSNQIASWLDERQQ